MLRGGLGKHGRIHGFGARSLARQDMRAIRPIQIRAVAHHSVAAQAHLGLRLNLAIAAHKVELAFGLLLLGRDLLRLALKILIALPSHANAHDHRNNQHGSHGNRDLFRQRLADCGACVIQMGRHARGRSALTSRGIGVDPRIAIQVIERELRVLPRRSLFGRLCGRRGSLRKPTARLLRGRLSSMRGDIGSLASAGSERPNIHRSILARTQRRPAKRAATHSLIDRLSAKRAQCLFGTHRSILS